MRFTKDHRGNLVLTSQAPALSERPRRPTREVAILPDGTEAPIDRVRSAGVYRCAGLDACKLADLKSDLRRDYPGVRFERRAR